MGESRFFRLAKGPDKQDRPLCIEGFDDGTVHLTVGVEHDGKWIGGEAAAVQVALLIMDARRAVKETSPDIDTLPLTDDERARLEALPRDCRYPVIDLMQSMVRLVPSNQAGGWDDWLTAVEEYVARGEQ